MEHSPVHLETEVYSPLTGSVQMIDSWELEHDDTDL